MSKEPAFKMVTGPGGRLVRLAVYQRQQAQMLRTITFGSGTVAVAEGDVVWVEINPHTGMTWIYDREQRLNAKLLYTLGAAMKPWNYVALIVPKGRKK